MTLMHLLNTKIIKLLTIIYNIIKYVFVNFVNSN